MESITNQKFKMKNISSKKLSSLGFRQSSKPDDNNTYYTYKFSAYKNDSETVLWGQITICLETNAITVDVYNIDYTTYRPFYFTEYGNYEPLLNKINSNIMGVFKKLDIVEVKKKRKKNEDKDQD